MYIMKLPKRIAARGAFNRAWSTCDALAAPVDATVGSGPGLRTCQCSSAILEFLIVHIAMIVDGKR